MLRYQLVTEQNNWPEPHVSSVVEGKEEVRESLETEAHLHRAFGWTVTATDDAVVCSRGGIVRVITYRAFTPMNDSI